jgi:hypothetical protein
VPKRIPIEVGLRKFPTKKETKDFIRAIVARYEDGVRLALEDEAFMRDLLTLHPHSEEKMGGGISHFTIGPDQEWGTTRNFIVHRMNGSFTDFSFHHCVDGTNHRQDRSSALRSAVADQVVNFKALAFSGTSVPVCVYLNKLLSESDSHVDHESPQTFHSLANAWLASIGRTVDSLELVDNADNQWIRTLRDPEMIRSWQKYHAANVRLRMISKRANLSHAKAKASRS